jgi:peptidyl-tRNA hydrolase
VKIGGGHGKMDQIVDYVLTAFSPADLPTLERACAEAADRVLEMIASGSRAKLA